MRQHLALGGRRGLRSDGHGRCCGGRRLRRARRRAPPALLRAPEARRPPPPKSASLVAAGALARPACPASMTASTSPLVMLPLGPVGVIWDGSRPYSSISLRTAGAIEPLPSADTGRRALARTRPSWRRRDRLLDDRAEQGADLDLATFLDGDLREHAAGRGVELQGHLVRLQLDQRLIGRHRIADLLEPSRDGRFGDRSAQTWHSDLHAHRLPSLLTTFPRPRRRRR